MKSLRIRISHLRNKVSEKLGDENDLFGYLGINKVGILESLEESYNLLAPLEEFKDKFETIFAKRKVAYYIDQINLFFDKYLESNKATDKFNDCLESVAGIRYVLRETYISISNKPLRIDSELAKARDSLTDSIATLEKIVAVKEQIDDIKDSSVEFISELESKHENSIKNEERIVEFATKAEEIDEELTGTNEKIGVWKIEIQSLKEDIASKQTSIASLKTEVEGLVEKNNELQESVENKDELLNTQISLNKKHQTQIQETIDDVSRSGMASSFKKRKDELRWTQIFWSGMTIVALCGLIFVSYFIVEPFLKGEPVELNQLFFKIPMFASAVWLGWFCSKQYGYTTRIREDYSYKYAISMAFEGYKNETREVEGDLLDKLMELTILNVSKNPVSIFDTKNNHGSPYNEMFETLSRNIFKQGKKEDLETED